MTDTKSFREGVIYALEYLESLYDGVEDTDIYKEYMEDDSE